MSYGEKMRRLRGKRSQAQVARHLGVAQTTVSSWESEARIPRDCQKKKIAEYYGATVQDIFF